jgi:hypothetical protein
MAIVFVIDGKPATKQRLPYIPREGEIVEMKDAKGIKMFTVDLVQHRIDNVSTIGIANTYIHLKSVKSKGKKKESG